MDIILCSGRNIKKKWRNEVDISAKPDKAINPQSVFLSKKAYLFRDKSSLPA